MPLSISPQHIEGVLHRQIIKEIWSTVEDIKAVGANNHVSIVLSGLVAMSIIVVKASVKSIKMANDANLDCGLEPLYSSRIAGYSILHDLDAQYIIRFWLSSIIIGNNIC